MQDKSPLQRSTPAKAAGPAGADHEDADQELVPAELVPPELVPDELVPAELVPAEVVPAEIVPAELVQHPLRPAFAASRPVRQVGPPSRLEVRLGFFPLGWLFLFCRPVVVLDGHAHRLGWGRYEFDLPPGQHHVRIFVPYLAWPECGANEVLVDLPPATYRSVRFYMWPWVYAPGSLTVH